MRQVYSAIQMMFFSIALSAIGSVISNVESLAAVGSLMSLLGGVMTILSIYRLKHENRHFPKAIRLFWIYLGISFVLILGVSKLLVDMAMDGLDVGLLPLAGLGVGAFVILVLALAQQYQVYAGLEELRAVRSLDYPPKRIMWCFYLVLISMIVSVVSMFGMVSLVIDAYAGGDAALYAFMDTVDLIGKGMLVFGVLVEAIHLWMMFTYMQAARVAFEQDGAGGWS